MKRVRGGYLWLAIESRDRDVSQARTGALALVANNWLQEILELWDGWRMADCGA